MVLMWLVSTAMLFVVDRLLERRAARDPTANWRLAVPLTLSLITFAVDVVAT
jgi:hypothetical protein